MYLIKKNYLHIKTLYILNQHWVLRLQNIKMYIRLLHVRLYYRRHKSFKL